MAGKDKVCRSRYSLILKLISNKWQLIKSLQTLSNLQLPFDLNPIFIQLDPPLKERARGRNLVSSNEFKRSTKMKMMKKTSTTQIENSATFRRTRSRSYSRRRKEIATTSRWAYY